MLLIKPNMIMLLYYVLSTFLKQKELSILNAHDPRLHDIFDIDQSFIFYLQEKFTLLYKLKHN